MPRRAIPVSEVSLTLISCICLMAFSIEFGRLLLTRQLAQARARSTGVAVRVTDVPVLFSHPFKANPYAAPPVTVQP